MFYNYLGTTALSVNFSLKRNLEKIFLLFFYLKKPCKNEGSIKAKATIWRQLPVYVRINIIKFL